MIIGITGGIGSGKSFVCHILQQMGYPVYVCDDAAKKLMQTDPTLRRQLTNLLGPDAYVDGTLNKEVVARYLFRNQENASRINCMVHPAVFRDMQSWYSRQSAPLCFVESAILFEAHFHTAMDATILVDADETVRLQRAMERDHTDATHIRSRMARQQSAADTRQMVDYVLTNNPDSDIRSEINRLIEYLNKTTK